MPPALAATYTTWLLEEKLTAGWREERLGSSLTTYGSPPFWVDTVAGAPADYGSAYVFTLEDDWEYACAHDDPGGSGHDNFGTAVDFHVQWLVVGAPSDEFHGSGFASLYEHKGYDPESWRYCGTVSESTGSVGDGFGSAVAVYNCSSPDVDYFVVGAPNEDTAIGVDAGAVYVYEIIREDCTSG
jgi:hypothetical protein